MSRASQIGVLKVGHCVFHIMIGTFSKSCPSDLTFVETNVGTEVTRFVIQSESLIFVIAN